MKLFTFSCPNCGQPLQRTEQGYRCASGHCFDCAKSGYTNLLRPDQKNAKLPGDNKLMVQARRNFLALDHYKPLSQAVAQAVQKLAPTTLLDAGCGEGYYTDFVAKQNPDTQILGIDISKFAVDYAARKNKSIGYAVGSIFHLPIADAACDVVLTMFAPYCGEEFLRVLPDGGHLVLVIPARDHLMGFKDVLYDDPYENEVKDYALDGFFLVDRQSLCYQITLGSQAQIQDLFTMTPYYYKTSKQDAKKLETLETLDTTVAFEVLTYRKGGA